MRVMSHAIDVTPTPLLDEHEVHHDTFDDEQPQSEDVEMEFVGTHEPRADLGVLEPDSDDEESIQLLAQMGCATPPDGRAEGGYTACPWPRQARATKEVTVSEIYYPPRIT